MTNDDLIEVRVYDLPARVLNTLRAAAIVEGLPPSNVAACRWALCQFARIIEEAASDEPRRSVS